MPVPTPICLATALYWPTGILNVVTANRRRLASPQRRWKPLKSRYMKVKTRPPITLRQRAYVRLLSRLVEFFSNFIIIDIWLLNSEKKLIKSDKRIASICFVQCTNLQIPFLQLGRIDGSAALFFGSRSALTQHTSPGTSHSAPISTILFLCLSFLHSICIVISTYIHTDTLLSLYFISQWKIWRAFFI